MINKRLKSIFIIFLLSILILGVPRCEQKSTDIIKKIKTIELGMNKDDVIKILGEPPKTLEYELDGVLYIALLYEAPSRLDSTAPSIPAGVIFPILAGVLFPAL
jgi:hypothetical protein